MNIVSIDSLSRIKGDKLLFEDISFGIDAGEKLALIGDNGTGKTTLLRLLAGREEPDNGRIALNSGLVVSCLEQVPEYDPADTVVGHILKGDAPLIRLVREYETCLQQLQQKSTEGLQQNLAGLVVKMDKTGGWHLERKIKSVLTELKVDDPLRSMAALSGGMIKRVALARALVQQAGLLLLDEPTNHLDVDTICWLEKYLQQTGQAVVIVTHDRYFLDTICTCILELDEQKLFRYNGNYSFYLEKKADYLHTRSKEQQRIETVLRTELQWLKRGPRARTGKSKARKDRIINLMDRQTALEQQDAEFSVNRRRLGKKILELKNISKAFNGNAVIKSFSYRFKKGERIGIIGPNGCGKTTLLRLITGRLQPDGGSVDTGIHTFFGYFDQLSAALDNNLTILEYLRQTAEYAVLNDGGTVAVPQLLESFAFPKSMFNTAIRYLSGGEKRRLYLVNVLLHSPNFLVFDEPTNDFDIRTLSMLENFLGGFSGCLVIVSHDRYFLDRTVDFLFIFNAPGNICGYGGNYSQYLAYLQETAAAEKQKQKPAGNDQKKTRIDQEKRKLSYSEKREYETLVAEIAALEKEQQVLETFFASGERDGSRWKESHTRYKAVVRQLEEKMARWIQLAEHAEE